MWFLASGTIIGQGAGHPPTATPIATYDTHELCMNSLRQVYIDTIEIYGKKNAGLPGIFFCVMTTQRK